MLRNRGYNDESQFVSATGRITSGIVMSQQKVCVDQRVGVGMGTPGVGLGSSVVAVEQNCPRVGHDSPAAGHGCPVADRDSPVVEQESVFVGQEFPVERIGSLVVEPATVAVRLEFLLERLNSPVVEQGDLVVEQEILCVAHRSLRMRKGSPSPSNNRRFLFGHVTEIFTLVGYSSKSSRLDHTSRSVRGPTLSGNSFRLLFAILVFLLTSMEVTSAGQCPSNSVDIASRTVLAKAIFIGQHVGQSSRQGPLWTAEFKVEEPLKGTDLPLKSMVHVSGLWREEGESGCATGNFTVKGKYFVLLNGSTEVLSEGTDGPRLVYWTSGLPVKFSKAAKKTVVRYSCPDCAEAPIVRLMTRSLPPDDRSASLNLRCRTSGRPTQNITWYKGTEVITIDGGRIKALRQGSQLSIRPALPSDAGLYMCSASNVLGSTNSTSVNVTVKASSSLDDASTSPAAHFVPCDQQVFCLNGGTCLTNPTLGQFCVCLQDFTGQRCQDRSMTPLEKKTLLQEPWELSLRNLFIVGLILIGLILLVLAVIAYCLAMTRYDNARRMSQWTAEDSEQHDVRANGALLRSLNGLQSEKQQKFSAANGSSGDSSADDRRMGLPQVLVTLIDDEDRTRTTITSGGRGGDLPPPQGNNANRPEVRVYCPSDQCATFPNLSRPRLAAVSTTPSSAASSVNLHMDNAGPTPGDDQPDSSYC